MPNTSQQQGGTRDDAKGIKERVIWDANELVLIHSVYNYSSSARRVRKILDGTMTEGMGIELAKRALAEATDRLHDAAVKVGAHASRPS